MTDFTVHSDMEGLRIGAVVYLNSKPLVEALPRLAPHAQIVVDLPSRLAAGLAEGTLDVALIPSIEYFRNPGCTIVSDACIASRGPVESVKLYSRVPIAEIRTLALDEGSRTSAALVRILLAERFGLTPRTLPLPIGAAAEDSPADATLLIGDRGMLPPQGHFAATWDLGEEWMQWTGLPFVFAMWIARPGVASDGPTRRTIARLLGTARDEGLRSVDAIARQEGPRLGLTVEQAKAYLRDCLQFHLGTAQRQGLARFYALAQRHALAPTGVSLDFDDQPLA